MRRWFTAIAILLIAIAAWNGGAGAFAQTPITFDRGSLEIVTADGAIHPFEIEIARKPSQQARGLMFRERMAADAGMLFIYDPPREISMWMKNTLIPLDMIFIDRDGTIIRIEKRTVPGSLVPISSGKTARAVLEVNGGMTDRLGIAPGDVVRHEAFGNAGS